VLPLPVPALVATLLFVDFPLPEWLVWAVLYSTYSGVIGGPVLSVGESFVLVGAWEERRSIQAGTQPFTDLYASHVRCISCSCPLGRGGIERGGIVEDITYHYASPHSLNRENLTWTNPSRPRYNHELEGRSVGNRPINISA
jgi:hypothetical protein